MKVKKLKIIIPFILIAIILLIISFFNTLLTKKIFVSDGTYKNEMNKLIDSGNYDKINYDYIKKDLDGLDEVLGNIVNKDIDITKKTEYYGEAQSIYDKKLNEISAVLNQVLDDEDFENYQNDIDDFYKNIDFAKDEIENVITSTIDSSYNVYKYMYEEKQRKCREVLETYKGFLNKK